MHLDFSQSLCYYSLVCDYTIDIIVSTLSTSYIQNVPRTIGETYLLCLGCYKEKNVTLAL